MQKKLYLCALFFAELVQEKQKLTLFMWQKIQDILRENTKVAENYVFMTLLQVLNVCFYLLLYPFLIIRLGDTGYGTYAFAWSVVTALTVVINFGFDLPYAKRVAQIIAEGGDKERMSDVLSRVQTAKIGLDIAVGCLYAILILVIPFFRTHWLLFAIGFAQTLSCIFFPQWYFQGVQRMRVVTYIQVGCKLLSLPFIFLCLHSPADVWILMLINISASLIGAIAAWLLIRYKDGVRMHIVSPRIVKTDYAEAFPFFLTNVMGTLKEQGIIWLVGGFLGMADVAVFDLASKIVTLPRTLMIKMNDALFPKIAVRSSAREIQRIMWVETILSLLAILTIAAIGKWLVLWLGHGELPAAYPVSIILSLTILFWMLGTSFINFVFVPTNNYYLVTINQAVSLVTCIGAATIWLTFAPSVYGIAAALAFSGLCEVLFCSISTHKKQLLT